MQPLSLSSDAEFISRASKIPNLYVDVDVCVFFI